jgi:hypothetical protein
VRALRPIGIGRKNGLVAVWCRNLGPRDDHHRDPQDEWRRPQAYLADVLARINDHKSNRLGDLLPWNWAPVASSLSEAACWQLSPMYAPSTTSLRCWASTPNLSKRSSKKDDKMTYGSIFSVYTGPEDAITALTDDGIDELKCMLRDARITPEIWHTLLDDFVDDAELVASIKANSAR